jgi:hypothetical protein
LRRRHGIEQHATVIRQARGIVVGHVPLGSILFSGDMPEECADFDTSRRTVTSSVNRVKTTCSGTPKGSYRPTKSSHSATHSSYSTARSSYHPAQSNYSTPGSSYSLTKGNYRTTRSSYSTMKSSYRTTRGNYSTAKSSYSKPNRSYGTPFRSQKPLQFEENRSKPNIIPCG